MDVRLYNTASRTIETLERRAEGISIYCCGPTVYNYAHIGNFSTFIAVDILLRLLKAEGYNPKFVRNITDIDDKIIQESQKEQTPLGIFTQKWEEQFHRDAAALQLLSPDVEPHAIAHIPEQIQLIKGLIENGNAYEENGSVYFDVSSWKDYGKLSRVSERELLEGNETHSEKHSPEDFVLWKAWKESDGTIYWDSPWGKGRPGWHTECSAMSQKYLGNTIDIHAGGIDLCFPHHENEKAQSEALHHQPFAIHWFHVSHLRVNNEKMSKSLHNCYTLRDIQKMGYSPMVLRFALLTRHYRQAFNFTFDTLHAAEKNLQKLQEFEESLRTVLGNPKENFFNEPCTHLHEVESSLIDDLNTPEALGKLFDYLNKRPKNISRERAQEEWNDWQRIKFILGIAFPEKKNLKIPQEILELAQERQSFRKAKNFAESDRVRNELQARGWQIKDRPDGFDLLPLNRS